MLNDDLLYVRNKGLSPMNHYGYKIMGKTLIEFFNEVVP